METEPLFKSLKKPLLSKEVEAQLRQSINSGIYSPGDKLPSERELVDQFEVSRVTVRDALKNLQNQGLISVKRGGNAGAYVSELTPQPMTQSINNLIQMRKVNFAHLIEIRLYVEPNAAMSAAIHRTSENVDMLAGLLDRAETYLDTSWKQARLTNVKFHCEVAKITGNALIVFLCESITQGCSAMFIEMTQAKLGKAAIATLISQHRTILEAIDEKNPIKAFQRAKRHLIETYDVYSRIIPDSFDGDVDKRIKYFAKL